MSETAPVILIITNSPKERDLLCGYLSQARKPAYKVVEESLGSRGIAAALSLNPACILLDEQLPDMTGLELLAQLQQQSGVVVWPVVLLVDPGNEAAALQALSYGLQDYLVKGQSSPEMLHWAVTNAIERAAMRRQMAQQRRDLAEKDRELEHYLAALHQERAERRQTEAVLEAQRTFLRQVIDLNPHFIFAKDRQGRFTLANQAVAEAYGVTVEELIGKTDAHFNPSASEVKHFRQDDLEVMDTLQEKFIPEEAITDAAGRVRWLQTIKRPLIGQNGLADQVLGVATDITAHKASERALRESEEALREGEQMLALAMRGGRMGAWWRDLATNSVWWSPELEELFGVEAGRFSGTEAGFYDFVHVEDRPLIAHKVEQAIAEQKDYLVEFRFYHADGTIRWMEGRGRATYSPEGQPLRLYGIGIDITERKEAEEALRRAHNELEQRVAERTAELEHSLQELNQFTYVASHDLKAPLRAVKNLANWVVSDTGDILPEASKIHLAKMQNRIERMEKFLDDLLVYSRVGRYYYQRAERVDSGALLKEIIDSLAPPPGFTIILQPELPVLKSQRILLEIVFKNLIDNALKHHHRSEGQIQISAYELGDFIEFTVTDDGPGIDLIFHERIFQIFQTLRPRDELEATGAGLAIVKKAVESQGGAIQVISAEGEGATFRFTWPKNSNIDN